MRRNTDSGAFSLIELTIAIGVAAISLIGIFTLLPIGLQTNYNAAEQTAANDMLASVIADLQATPKTSATSSQFGISIPANTGGTSAPVYLDSQGRKSMSANAARYRLTINFPDSTNGGASPKAPTFVQLRMTWPAVASPANPVVGSAETFVTLNRN